MIQQCIEIIGSIFDEAIDGEVEEKNAMEIDGGLKVDEKT